MPFDKGAAKQGSLRIPNQVEAFFQTRICLQRASKLVALPVHRASERVERSVANFHRLDVRPRDLPLDPVSDLAHELGRLQDAVHQHDWPRRHALEHRCAAAAENHKATDAGPPLSPLARPDAVALVRVADLAPGVKPGPLREATVAQSQPPCATLEEPGPSPSGAGPRPREVQAGRRRARAPARGVSPRRLHRDNLSEQRRARRPDEK
mmetsp:Transcript_24289/g.61564  ORF Transcript_24289/g.61564 Transcript_24289/m.61564 type:complete len:209 (-) Transcript_24289:66-692(-)